MGGASLVGKPVPRPHSHMRHGWFSGARSTARARTRRLDTRCLPSSRTRPQACTVAAASTQRAPVPPRATGMPAKFFCDYCDAFLTHDSVRVPMRVAARAFLPYRQGDATPPVCLSRSTMPLLNRAVMTLDDVLPVVHRMFVASHAPLPLRSKRGASSTTTATSTARTIARGTRMCVRVTRCAAARRRCSRVRAAGRRCIVANLSRRAGPARRCSPRSRRRRPWASRPA